MTTKIATYTALFWESTDAHGCLESLFTGLVKDTDAKGLAKARAEVEERVAEANKTLVDHVTEEMRDDYPLFDEDASPRTPTEAEIDKAIEAQGGLHEVVERSGLVLVHHLPDGIDESDKRVILTADRTIDLDGYAYAIDPVDLDDNATMTVSDTVGGHWASRSAVASIVGDMLDRRFLEDFDERAAVADVDARLMELAVERGVRVDWDPDLGEVRVEHQATLDLDGKDAEDLVKDLIYAAADAVAEDINCT